MANNPNAQRSAVEAVVDAFEKTDPTFTAALRPFMKGSGAARLRGLRELRATLNEGSDLANALDGVLSRADLWGDDALRAGLDVESALKLRPGPDATPDQLLEFASAVRGVREGEFAGLADQIEQLAERSADVPKAVRDILAGKCFDYGTICASEQAVVADVAIDREVRAQLGVQGAYFLTPAQADQLAKLVVTPQRGLNPKVVGKPATTLAEWAGISVPPGTRCLIAEVGGVGRDYPLSIEKLSPILAYYTADGLEAGAQFDCVASNPPYVREGEIPDLPPDVRLHEPLSALAAGPRGLDVIERLIAEAPPFLAPGGWLLMEISPRQVEAVTGALRAHGGYDEVRALKDLSGQARVVRAGRRG